jgi:hypothetical protein
VHEFLAITTHPRIFRTHAVRELWTADRDFSAFPALRVRNPLLA